MFSVLFIICFVLFCIALIVSINPKWISRGEKPIKRKYTLLTALSMFVIGIVFANLGSGNSVKSTVSPVTAPITAPITAGEPAKAIASDAAAKVNIAGAVTPSIAQKGEKVIIKIDVENLDANKTIDGVRLLFSDMKFLDQGLIIVNVMSGGIQDGRAFVWQGEMANIPPKGKRSYQIVAQANNPGTYQSIINIKSPSTGLPYSDPEGNEELNAKLVVLN